MLQYTLQTDIHPQQIVHSVAFSPDGQLLAVGTSDGLRVYQISSSRLLLRIYTLSTVLCLCWDTRGDLLCGCQSGYLAVITIDCVLLTVDVVFSQVSESAVSSITIHPTGAYLAMAETQSISIWRQRKKSLTGSLCALPWVFVKEFSGPRGHTVSGSPPSIAWMDGKSYTLASSYGFQGIRVWNIHDQDPVFSVPIHVFEGSLSPCGRYFANSDGKSVRIIEMETCVDVKTLECSDSLPSPTPVIWVHGGGFVLNARDGRADLWHVSSKRRRCLELPGKLSEKPVTHLASFMGTSSGVRTFQIALVSDRSHIFIWTAEQGIRDLPVPHKRSPLVFAAIAAVILLIIFNV